MKVLVAAGRVQGVLVDDFSVFVGVDHGAYWLLEHKLPLNLAVGDFDSLEQRELGTVERHADDVLYLEKEKNETDLEAAVLEVMERYPDAEITILGALGGRLDHELTNLFLPTRAEFAAIANRIQIIDHQNKICYLKAGEHVLQRDADKEYIGFVRVNATNFSIEGAKYPLAVGDNWSDIYASNEFVRDTMTVKFDSGMVIVIYSKD